MTPDLDRFTDRQTSLLTNLTRPHPTNSVFLHHDIFYCCTDSPNAFLLLTAPAAPCAGLRDIAPRISRCLTGESYTKTAKSKQGPSLPANSPRQGGFFSSASGGRTAPHRTAPTVIPGLTQAGTLARCPRQPGPVHHSSLKRPRAGSLLGCRQRRITHPLQPNQTLFRRRDL